MQCIIMPWGHMIFSLEDVTRTNSLRVHKHIITGVTVENYRLLLVEHLGYQALGAKPD